MSTRDDQPIIDQVTLNDEEAQVYEAIATLEFIGRRVRADDIVSTSRLDDDSVRQVLGVLTRRGVLRAEKHGAEPVYVPAHRGWSAAPEQAAPSR